MRDMDMLFEIVDPGTGRRVPEGETGEIVFSTLNREAMPLIRYRTGDRAAFQAGRCPCGMETARIGRFQGRFQNQLRLQNGECISIETLDEAVFDLEPVLDYTAGLTGGHAGHGGSETLRLALLTIGTYNNQDIERRIRERIQINCALEITAGNGFFTRGVQKRDIQRINTQK
jgi:phenylacetate-coenzyme A ligase PaaK-like adenylate-forming protein